MNKVFATSGEHRATVMVTDYIGLTCTAAGSVRVVAPKLVSVSVATNGASIAATPATLDFDGTQSIDDDGTGASSSVVSKSLSEVGTHGAVLRITDNPGAVATATTLVEITAPRSTAPRVADIGLTRVKSGARPSEKAGVVVSDTAGPPVSGAKVIFRSSAVVPWAGSAVTDPAGTMSVLSKSFLNPGTLTFIVTGLSKGGYTYSSADNAVTMVTIVPSGTGR